MDVVHAVRQSEAVAGECRHLQHPRHEGRPAARRRLLDSVQRHRQALARQTLLDPGALEEMSIITLETAKGYLDVIHNADDAKLQTLLDAAEDEAAQYINQPLDELQAEEASSEQPDALPGSVVMGVMLLLQAAYQATPDDAEKLRRAAEVKLTPYRIGGGV